MSDSILDPVDDIQDVGQTSHESGRDGASKDDDVAKKPWWKKFNVYEAMLLVSLLCIVAAIFLIFFELNKFGKFPSSSYPWRTDEAIANPISN